MKSSSNSPLIAIVDDDLSVCNAIKRLVKTYGIEAEIFASGLEFIYVLEATPSFAPSCLILDMQMPILNGLEVQQRLAWMGRNIPTIFVSGVADAKVREKALATNAVAFFSKPLNEKPFIQTLYRVLGTGDAKQPERD